MAIKSGKMVKSLEFFFFFLSYSKCFTSEFFFVLVKSFSILSVRLQCIIEKSFVPVFFKVSIDHSVDKPESGKRNKLLLWKKSTKSLEFWIQKSIRTLSISFSVNI